MSRADVIARNEELHKITAVAKEGIDEYIQNVHEAVGKIESEVQNMNASGDTIDQIKEILYNDLKQLNADIRKLETLSGQMQGKIEGYKRYLDYMKKGLG